MLLSGAQRDDLARTERHTCQQVQGRCYALVQDYEQLSSKLRKQFTKFVQRSLSNESPEKRYRCFL